MSADRNRLKELGTVDSELSLVCSQGEGDPLLDKGIAGGAGQQLRTPVVPQGHHLTDDDVCLSPTL